MTAQEMPVKGSRRLSRTSATEAALCRTEQHALLSRQTPPFGGGKGGEETTAK
jgi:hypothetical protein